MSFNKLLCGPCLDEKIEKEGVLYCRDCEEPLCEPCQQDHGRIKISKHHKLCDLSDVPPREIQDLMKSLIACPNHLKEEVVYLCEDHDVTCCSKCAMAKHRKCEEVKVLSDVLHDIKVDCSGLKTALREMQLQGESLLAYERKHEELIAERERTTISLLQDIKKKLLDTYNKIEKKVLSSIANRKKLIFEQIGAQREGIRNILNDIEHQSSCIEQVEKFGTEDRVVLLQRKIEKETRPRLKSSVIDFDKSRTRSSFACTTNSCLDTLLIEIRNSLRFEETVCGISETRSDSDIKHASTYTERNLQLQFETDSCELQLIDKKDRIPDTCIWIDHHIVILTTVPSLIVFHEDNKSLLSKFNCQSNPWTVSKTGPNEMVITLPRESKIAFAQLSHGNVNLVAVLTTIVPYHDVAMDTALNQYICLSNTNGQIDVLNIDGTLLQSLSFSSEMITSIKSSRYLALHVNNRTLFLSKFFSDEITALNLQGQHVFDYKHKYLKNPRICTVDPSGNVYVVSVSAGNIHQISPTGRHIRSLLLGELHTPRGLCFNETFDKLAIVGDKVVDGINKSYLRLYTYI